MFFFISSVISNLSASSKALTLLWVLALKHKEQILDIIKVTTKHSIQRMYHNNIYIINVYINPFIINFLTF